MSFPCSPTQTPFDKLSLLCSWRCLRYFSAVFTSEFVEPNWKLSVMEKTAENFAKQMITFLSLFYLVSIFACCEVFSLDGYLQIQHWPQCAWSRPAQTNRANWTCSINHHPHPSSSKNKRKGGGGKTTGECSTRGNGGYLVSPAGNTQSAKKKGTGMS